MKYYLKIIIILFSLLLVNEAQALGSFVVQNIKVHGLQRIQLGTVLTYLPIRVGQTFDQEKSSSILHSLYETGFFTDIHLLRENSTLVIDVVERPTIGSISVTGNKDIPKDKLDEELKKLELVEGKVFNRGMLDRVREGLKAQYNSLGKYNARIDVKVAPLTRNRVAVTVIISEGVAAKIKQIKIIGNKAFDQDTLKHEFVLSTSTVFSFFSGSDQYSRERLEASLEAMRSYYMDRGYIKMHVNSTQVSITPDHKHVYITVSITEGSRYYFQGFDLKGEFNVIPKDQLRKLVTIKSGAVFSRKEVSEAITAMGNALGDKGYGMPHINAEPKVDEVHKTVFITFMIHPGKQIYVRRINFIGNTKTADYVLRHQMRQEEGGLLSLTDIKESERRLRVLGFFKEVEMKTEPVPGTDDQVDLTYKVKEQQSSKITLSGGYQFGAGLIINAGIEQPNFLGTGKSLGLHFATDNFGYYYSVSWFNPFYSPNGVGRGFEVYYAQTKKDQTTDTTDYRSNRLGGMVNYEIPFSSHTHFRVGYGYDHYELRKLKGNESTQVTAFQDINGDVFNSVRLTGSWSHSSYDTFLFPTQGDHQQLAVLLNLPGSSENFPYYKANYQAHFYYPLAYGFIFETGGFFGWGDSFKHDGDEKVGLPFYENYFAGGVAQGQVRGYDSYELGPRDSKDKPMGGNLLVSGTAAIILPPPISRPTLRSSIFVDGGQVYGVNLPSELQGTSAGPVRFSAGVGVLWNSPFGTLGVSTALPLNRQCHWHLFEGDTSPTHVCDRTQAFQFNIMTGF